MINPRLFDHYGIDTKKNLGIDRICPRPFDTVLIDSNGSCYVCECTAWLPQSIGNLQVMELQDLIDNSVHQQLKNSIRDGSYRYCNNNQCSYLLDDRPQTKFQSREPSAIKYIRLGLDSSCNLRCPSCRTQHHFLSGGRQLQNKKRIIDKIVKFVRGNTKTHIHIGSDGDPFASLVYRYFLRQIRDLKHVTVSVQTNGLLIKKMYIRNRPLFDKLTELNISIDGASRDTYETLRLNGRWSKIKENLDFVKQIKLQHKFKLIFHYVVQRTNYKEMTDMIHMSEQYDADKVWLNKITDWNTFSNFQWHDVTDPKNDLYDNYKEVLKHTRTVARTAGVKVEMPTLGHFE